MFTWYFQIFLISSLSYSVVFLYVFALFIEGLLFLLFSATLHSVGYIFPFPLLFASLRSSAICKTSSDNHFAFMHFFFFGIVLFTASCTMLRTSVHSSSGALSDLIPWSDLSPPLYNHKRFYLGHIWMAWWFSLPSWEIKMPVFFGSWRKQGSSRKTFASPLLITLKPLSVWITTNWKIFREIGIPNHLTCLLRNL